MNYYNLANYFYDIAFKHSNKTALCYKNASITYDELNKLSNKIANYFLSLDIKKYDVIGIFNTKEPTGYATMMACLKTGVAYTNIDEGNPLIRLEKIISTCKPKLLVCDHKPSELIQKASKKLHINLVDFSNNTLFEDFKDTDLKLSEKIIGSTPAYIMFTSGSTGTPKGVAVSHSNILSFLGWSIERYGITSDDIFAGISPLYFDNSVFDFYTALFSGASLAPIKKEVAKNPQELIKLVDMMRCSVWFSVPSLLVYLLTMKLLSEKTLQSIKIFTFGGEGFPKGELKKLYSLYNKNAKLINVYGPTEGTCICSSYEINEKDFQDMGTLSPLGTINPNFDYLILDENMNKVAHGQKGELCLIGPNIALGYYNDFRKTDQNFVQNPFTTTHRDIIYKTGDIVYEKEGLLWFASRADNQIKHMGYRIELEEIESALNSIPYVRQSAVIYERVKLNYGKIAAFIATDQNISEREIKNDLNTMLPDYMVPTIIKTMPNLPKNENGKVDKKQLSSTL